LVFGGGQKQAKIFEQKQAKVTKRKRDLAGVPDIPSTNSRLSVLRASGLVFDPPI